MAADPTRAELPGGQEIALSTRWVQQALQGDPMSGGGIVVDGIAGPRTMGAIQTFRAIHAPTDPISPHKGATNTRLVVGARTEIALLAFHARGPVRPEGTSPPVPEYGGAAADPAVPVSSGGSFVPVGASRGPTMRGWLWIGAGLLVATGIGLIAWSASEGRPRARALRRRR